MKKIAVILYGPPGSGKGTQADFIAKKFGLIHFDTGAFMEALVHDPARQKSKVIQRERKLFDSGKLMTPSFVLRMVKNQVKKIAQAGWGVVFSGSPRTLYEAKGLLPFLEKVYGIKKISVFILDVPPEVSIERNSNRLICKMCKSPLLMAYYPSRHPKYCPICGGPLYKRTLDNAQVIKVRLEEYQKRTAPIFDLMRKKNYKINSIKAVGAPYKVFQSIARFIK